MTDGQEDLVVPEDERQLPAAESAVPAPVIDDWAKAFGSLEEKPPAAPEGSEGEPGPAVGAVGSESGEAPAPASGPGEQSDDLGVDAGGAGGPVPASDADGGTAGPVDVDTVIAGYQAEVERLAIDATAQLLLERADANGNRLIRQTNGRLGATINDPDIYRVDPDTGAPTFYNPDTGRPFTGDNPRAQAKEWVENYNEDLREAFNQIAAQQRAQLDQEYEPMIRLLRFTPKYDALDTVRQKMLDALIEDYEVLGADGKAIGYSVDLDKALEQVNRQVAALKTDQDTASRAAAEPPKPVVQPALDMRTNSGSGTPGREIRSLAEAMEAEQDAILEKSRKK